MGKRGEKDRKGQVTIFVIVALVVVAIGVLIYFLFPGIRQTIGLESKDPYQFIQECLQDDVNEAVMILSNQGGSINPEHYIIYNDENIEYLCYTSEYYVPCVMQRPLLKQHIESEIKDQISQTVQNCFNDLEENYQSQGYATNLRRGEFSVELLPKRIVTSFNHTLTLTKDNAETFDRFRVILNNNLYELVSITNSILNWEARYGDAETTAYMNYYRDLKVEKKVQLDGSTIYILTDRNNENKFQFASRSVAWPPGYGV